MRELVRSNDLVDLSWCQAVLEEAGIHCAIFDSNTAVIEGSIGAIQRRLMVLDEDFDSARALLSRARAETREAQAESGADPALTASADPDGAAE